MGLAAQEEKQQILRRGHSHLRAREEPPPLGHADGRGEGPPDSQPRLRPPPEGDAGEARLLRGAGRHRSGPRGRGAEPSRRDAGLRLREAAEDSEGRFPRALRVRRPVHGGDGRRGAPDEGDEGRRAGPRSPAQGWISDRGSGGPRTPLRVPVPARTGHLRQRGRDAHHHGGGYLQRRHNLHRPRASRGPGGSEAQSGESSLRPGSLGLAVLLPPQPPAEDARARQERGAGRRAPPEAMAWDPLEELRPPLRAAVAEPPHQLRGLARQESHRPPGSASPTPAQGRRAGDRPAVRAGPRPSAFGQSPLRGRYGALLDTRGRGRARRRGSVPPRPHHAPGRSRTGNRRRVLVQWRWPEPAGGREEQVGG
mmetsp:Transcript_8632/g.21233  ORF Transcript_8632/g.21233 Transcript_8632/m.21233 type:complete len:367 (-) Transcript_8632:1246-2346(-)